MRYDIYINIICFNLSLIMWYIALLLGTCKVKLMCWFTPLMRKHSVQLACQNGTVVVLLYFFFYFVLFYPPRSSSSLCWRRNHPFPFHHEHRLDACKKEKLQSGIRKRRAVYRFSSWPNALCILDRVLTICFWRRAFETRPFFNTIIHRQNSFFT